MDYVCLVPSLSPVPVTHILTLSGRSLQSQPFHRESFYVTGTRVPFSSCRVSPPSLRSLGSSLHSVPEPVGCRERSGKGRAEGQGETRQKEPDPRSVPPPFIPPSLRSVALSLRSFPPPFARGASGGYGEGGG